MTISTITIGTTDYTSYSSLAEANERLAVDAKRATKWSSKTDDQKRALLVQATYTMDLLNWGGEKTGGDSQANAFPRTGLTYASGGSVSTTEVPLQVGDATSLLAGSIALDSDAGEAGPGSLNVKRVKGGTAEVEFFRHEATSQLAGDDTAYALVREFLEGYGVTALAVSSGTDTTESYATSSFEDIDAWGRDVGFP